MEKPTRIAVLSEPLLAERYGDAGVSVIRAAEGLPAARLVVSRRRDAEGIRRDLQATLRSATGASVLLLGGVATMPFFELPLPGKQLDADALVPTDNPYGVPGGSVEAHEVALPERAVGRIPDHPDDTAASFAARIGALCAVVPPDRGGSACYLLSTQSWKRTSASMATRVAPPPEIDLSPPRAPGDFARPAFVPADARRHLFNLHGSDRVAPWFGETASGSKYPPAFDPAAVVALAASRRVTGAVVVSQACYGAFLLIPGGLRRTSQACCLQLLEHGAAAFLGSTTIAYGGTTGAMVCSDVLAVEFLRAAAEGLPLGAALQQARRVLAAAVRSPPPGTELKTLLQFVLYGDPQRIWARPAPSAKAVAGAEVGAADLSAYSLWSEEALPVRKGALAAPEAGWAEVARFKSIRPPRGIAPAVRRMYRCVGGQAEPGKARAHDELFYYRESVTYPDGTTFEARSTGGRARKTVQEEESGAAPWWRHAVAAHPRQLEALKKKPGPSRGGGRRSSTAAVKKPGKGTAAQRRSSGARKGGPRESGDRRGKQ